jgi:hypothetical protein
MPVLLRAAAVSDVEPGERRLVKVRGEKMWLVNSGDAVRAYGNDCMHAKRDGGSDACRHYRTHVRGGWVYVALDPVANSAPADVHLSDRDPTPVLGPRPAAEG